MSSSPVKRARVDESNDEESQRTLCFLGNGKHEDTVLVRFFGTAEECQKIKDIYNNLLVDLGEEDISTGCLVDLFDAVQYTDSTDAADTKYVMNALTMRAYVDLRARTKHHMWIIQRNEEISGHSLQNVYALLTFSTE